jgi:two-component system sensor kinase FixL
MIVVWGPERVLLYNEGYVPILRYKHPWAFGRPFFEVWPEVRLDVGGLFERVFAGESVQMDDMAVTLNRGDGQEEAHFSFSYTPVWGEDGAVAGLFCTCNETTDWVLARQRLENQRVRQQQMLQQMPGFVAMLSGPDHRFQYVNGAFIALAGSRDFAGRAVRDVFPEIEGQGFFEPLDKAFRSGVAFSARAAPVRFSGEQDARYIDLNMEAMRDDSGQITGVFIGGYDVTEVERSAAALQKSETVLAAIVASSDDAIISKTMDGVVTSWNAGAERLFGYSADEMIGQSISRLSVDGREDEMSRILARLSKDERIDHFETVRRHKTGAEVFVSLTVSPMHDEAGRVIGASKVARDITAARASADALKRAQDRLREQHLELLHAARLGELGQMSATLAHEINQPLSAIVNYLHAGQSLIRRDDPSARPMLAEALRRAAEQASRTAEVVRRLRVFAKPNEGLLKPEPINSILEETTAMAAFDARRLGVEVALALDPEAGLVSANRIEIQQVLLNLIRNALEAMETEVRGDLRLSTASEGDKIVVSVGDTGPGLDPKIRARLFEPFNTSKRDGMGIGLSICRRIVEAHQGSIWTDAEPKGGTTFRFSLPKAPGPPATSGSPLRPMRAS